MRETRGDMSSLNSNSPAPKLLVISMHLGKNITEGPDGEWTVKNNEQSILAAALEALKLDANIECVNIGWVGKKIPVDKQDRLTSELMLNHGCYPLYLTQDEAEAFYHRFCKGVLWPTMNYSLATSRRFYGIEELWDSHKKIMTYIADTVATVYRTGDVIWIHDYHLLCLPAFIRKRHPGARIGFYLHCTFPSSELFRQIPIRESILQGLCCADVIGFQTYNYCRYFLRSVSNLLGWETGPTSITAPTGKVCRVHVDPTGLKVSLYEGKLDQTYPLAEKWRQGFYSNAKIIVGRCTRLDKYQGIVEKLLAFDHFLTQYPEFIEKVILMQSIIDNETISRDAEDIDNAQLEAVYEERSLLVQRVEQLVGRINGIHGTLAWQPVHIHIKPQDNIENSLALDHLADVVMITPTRDGMNLIAHESVLATQHSFAPLILSEFAGAASCLGGSIIVNPYDKANMAEAMVRALRMDPADKKKNHAHNLRYVQHNSIGQWARTCVAELIREDDEYQHQQKLNGPVLREFVSAYKEAKNRLLLLDFEGTAATEGEDRKLTVNSTMKDCIEKLSKDDKNILFLLTGKGKDTLAEFEDMNQVGLCSGHGMLIKYPNEPAWVEADERVDLSWKEPVRNLYLDFRDRTPGTGIEEFDMELTWTYEKADQDFARWVVQDLVQVLHQMADKYPIFIKVMRTSVQVRPRNLTPGSVCRRILAKYSSIDVVYRIGSNCTDDCFPSSQDMSGSLNSSNGTPTSPLSAKAGPTFYSCNVGEIPTGTSLNGFFVNNQAGAASLLSKMCS
eukprot:TRINITY_DN30335_c0_g1_i1.p1 TRINITY_DN30335_c0_g1~~TRINITY_DN30335_c0_g1_i1.p1  ORF type:complete len:789 (+),score=81.70 TRINITY_DN30335_c0_g1_i1:58-2424(+)